MKKQQKDILFRLAKSHGLSQGQAEEVWSLFINTIVDTISKEDKLIDGYFNEEKFKTVHIDNFGKFIPNIKKIYYANMCLKKKKEND
jgi:nucleoid DNA-binding protein